MDPKDEIIARMTRSAGHRSEPPSRHTRPAANVHLFDAACAFLRSARPEQRRALASAFTSDPSWQLDFHRAVEIGALATRTAMRGVRLVRCKSNYLSIGPAIIEDVTIDGLAMYQSMLIFGAVFRHVTLRGRIGRIIYNPQYEWAVLPTHDPRLEAAFLEANAAYWATVDRALDIREARFSSVTLRGIPAHPHPPRPRDSGGRHPREGRGGALA